MRWRSWRTKLNMKKSKPKRIKAPTITTAELVEVDCILIKGIARYIAAYEIGIVLDRASPVTKARYLLQTTKMLYDAGIIGSRRP